MHAPLPLLCDPCVETLLKDVEDRRSAKPSGAICWCPHHKTLAICIVKNGNVESWNMSSPVSAQEATKQIAKFRSGSKTDKQKVTH
jgi:hypothetical protein